MYRTPPRGRSNAHEPAEPRSAGFGHRTLICPNQAGPRGSSRAKRLSPVSGPPRLDARADGLIAVKSLPMLITVEGLDGAGKTTLIQGLAANFEDATVLREPGGVELSEKIRALVADPNLEVDPRAEALLYAAARAQLVAE